MGILGNKFKVIGLFIVAAMVVFFFMFVFIMVEMLILKGLVVE